MRVSLKKSKESRSGIPKRIQVSLFTHRKLKKQNRFQINLWRNANTVSGLSRWLLVQLNLFV